MDLNRSPILVFWEATRACLLACRHCRAEAIERPLPGELTTGEAARLIRQLAAGGERPPVLIVTGGDFLMRRDALPLITLARSLGIPVGAAPSVTPLLTAAVRRQLREAGVKSVSVSLDGATPATHEGVRGVGGHFEATLDTLRSLVDDGFAVQVNTTVMGDNVDELADLAALLLEVGVRIWEVFFLVKTGRGTDVAELTAQDNEEVAHFLYDASRWGLQVRTVEGPFFRRVAAWRRALPDGEDPVASFALGPRYQQLRGRLEALVGRAPGTPKAQTLGTRDGKGIVFISYCGDVYPSGFLPLAVGDVRTRDLFDIYRSAPLLRQIRSGRFSGRCGVCDFRELCGGSRARAFAASGDPLGEDPACAYRPPPQ